MGKTVNRIEQSAMDMLTDYAWPGNVRELNNVIERAIILCQDGVLCPDQFSIASLPSSTPNREDTITLESAERQHILNALEKTHWVVGGLSGPARLLDINRTTLLARMKKMGIERDM